MKKYNKPEIVALALETVDVIETSGQEVSASYAAAKYSEANVQQVTERINAMDDKWSW